jgi:hypothetical protein
VLLPVELAHCGLPLFLELAAGLFVTSLCSTFDNVCTFCAAAGGVGITAAFSVSPELAAAV